LDRVSELYITSGYVLAHTSDRLVDACGIFQCVASAAAAADGGSALIVALLPVRAQVWRQ
jgi:hypothetical protein